MGNNYFMNTPQKGSVRCIVFRDGKTWFGTALEFNITESSDDPVIAMLNLQEAIQGYVESIKKIKGLHDFSSLNQKTEVEYEKMWLNLHSAKPVRSPYEVYHYGVTTISA